LQIHQPPEILMSKYVFAALLAFLASFAFAANKVDPATGTLWVYHNGKFYWGGDWSFAASPDYRDKAGAPLTGSHDVAVTGKQWGGWQPYVDANCQNDARLCFSTVPYTYLIFSAKPTVPKQVFAVGFMASGDTADGPVMSNVSAYCSGGSNPAVGEWESCKIPLAAFKLTNTTILKFWIQDETGLQNNLWYADDVGFQ